MSVRDKAIVALLLGLAAPLAWRVAAGPRERDMQRSAEAWCSVHYASLSAPAKSRRLCGLWGYR